MRWVKAIAAVVAMLAVIVGAPVLLLRWGGVGQGWWRADDGSLFFTILTFAGWSAWLAFTLATGLEVVRQAGGRRFVPDLPLLGGLQALCAGLVLAVVSVSASSGGSVAPTPGSTLGTLAGPSGSLDGSPTPRPTMHDDGGAASRADQDEAGTRTARSDRDGFDPPGIRPGRAGSGLGEGRSGSADPPVPGSGELAAPTPRPSVLAAAGQGYTVGTGDDLWSVAERLYGDGRRWRELARANPDLLSDPTGRLIAGTQLRLPGQAAAAAATPKTVIVERGDTLSGLAREHLGSAGRWPRIAAANAGLVSDPDHIEIGWELVIPRGFGQEPRPQPPTPDSPATVTDDGAAATSGERVSPATTPQVEPTTGPEAEAPGLASPSSQDARPTPITGPSPRIAVPDQVSAGRDGSPETPSGAIPEAAAGEAPSGASPAEAAAASEATPDRTLIGSLGVLAAAGLMGGWQARRLLQRRVRQPGRRVIHPDDDLARLHAAVGRRQVPNHTALLEAALRAIGNHHHREGLPLPTLEQVRLTAERACFDWSDPAGPPPAGFEGDDTVWWVAAPTGDVSPWDATEHPCSFPALVSLGTSVAGETVLVDLERSGVVGIAAELRELQLASLASITVELACVPWASELALVSVGAEGDLPRVAGGEGVTWLRDADTALDRLRQQHRRRQRELTGLDLRRLRTDPERSDAVAPQVYVFHDPLTLSQRQEVDDLLAGSELGIAAVLPVDSDADAQWELFGDPLHPRGRLGSEELDAHAIPESTRAAVASWYQVAEATRTEPAPWWSESDAPNLRILPSRHPPSEDSVDIVSLRRLVRPHPTLLLIGSIELQGAAGPEPSRARYQLIELCSWLLEHPGRTATEMAAGLGIAESTRRSNLSRLRTWLGADTDGQPYLPEAYSGRIRLHSQVTSDIGQLRLLTGPGVNRIGEDGLIAALDLVRGDLLADAAPGQWYWAEELRSDVAATLRDAGLVLVDRALDRGEFDLARWAVQRALTVASEDELLMCARIRTEHAAGNRPGVERHVLRLTQQARALGVDLLPQTVMLCQQVMEGRTRSRRA